MNYNDRGEELPDDTPIELPVKFKRPPSLQEQIQQMVRRELSEVAQSQGFESFEESDDFEVDDDNDIRSVHELTPMQEDVRYAKPDKSVLDKRDGKEDDTPTPEVKVDKEGPNVQQSGIGGDSKGAVAAAKVG